MKIFKFGGAAVQHATGVQNACKIITANATTPLVIVVSAMGKMTNAFERIVAYYLANDPLLTQAIQETKTYHHTIASELFKDQEHPVFTTIAALYEDLSITLARNKSKTYAYVYDQIVGYAELLSTQIVSSYLSHIGYSHQWLDARTCIKTDSTYRDASVDWIATQQAIEQQVVPQKNYLTQGFIGSNVDGFSTTLGREGSDYSAGIFGYCLAADSVTIWKDVPGVLNGDPRVFEQTVLLSQLSYKEAIEFAFYGASVIHPKTLQPLERKAIPLHVRSFVHPENTGTVVQKGTAITPQVPCYIVKNNQKLVSLSSLDFSFIGEDTMRAIFDVLDRYQLKVGLMQRSAISFSMCLEDKFANFDALLQELKTNYRVTYNEQVALYTIRHFTPQAIAVVEQEHTVLLQQTTRETYQIVVKQ